MRGLVLLASAAFPATLPATLPAACSAALPAAVVALLLAATPSQAQVLQAQAMTPFLPTASGGSSSESLPTLTIPPLPGSPGTVWSATSTLPDDSWMQPEALDPAYWSGTGYSSSSISPAGVALVRRLPRPCSNISPGALPHQDAYIMSTGVASIPSSPCPADNRELKPFVSSPVKPLTSAQKAHLAFRDLINPGNFATIAGNAAFTVATNAHTAYGPGIAGMGRNAGVSFTGELSGEVIGTWAVCSLTHQDPRYFRMPNASPLRRVAHAVAHVAIAQADNGRAMPNYENFISSYAVAELANLYVPGLNTNQPSTNRRIFSGFLSEPIGNLIAEFLPDFASHVHVRLLIVQQYVDRISLPGTTMPNTSLQ